jgi:hypothetical protein
VALIRERSPVVGEISVNILRIEGCRVVSVTDPYGGIVGFLDVEQFFLPSSSSIVLTILSGLRPRPTNKLTNSMELGTTREIPSC